MTLMAALNDDQFFSSCLGDAVSNLLVTSSLDSLNVLSKGPAKILSNSGLDTHLSVLQYIANSQTSLCDDGTHFGARRVGPCLILKGISSRNDNLIRIHQIKI